MNSSDPLAIVDSSQLEHSNTSTESKEHTMPPHTCTSSKDANENDKSQRDYENNVPEEKKFDFLVWHHSGNQVQADLIYENLEARGLSGYKPERDRVLGQYKLSAMEDAIKNTSKFILLVSKEALTCQEFQRKMHATITSSESLIPIYVDIGKTQVSVLRHHVDIQFRNDKAFWVRLHSSITRPIKALDKPANFPMTSKSSKKLSPQNPSSPQTTIKKPITVVPELRRAQTRPGQTAKPQSKPTVTSRAKQTANTSEASSSWSFNSLFSKKKKKPEEPAGIQMEPVSTRKDM